MVCKENVVSWFGNLSSYKRIDVMCTLLNMCLPFEVRYLGTCVEDLGKRDYNVLRDTEHRANNVSDLTELTNLGMTDKRTRRKLALYMALLHSCNYSCAVVLYKSLSNFDFQEISNLLNGTNYTQDDQPLEELLLLYTMALNHPAFNYEQKSTFGNIFLKLQEEEVRLNIPKSGAIPFKSTQSCIPCLNQNDRMDPDISSNCVVPPPPIQTFQGEMSMRSNAMFAGVPPGLGMPPPGLCMPGPEQIAMHGTGHPQYVHVGFPSVNHMPPWPGQLMMAHNQFMYHPSDVLPYPTSPLVSRQSSPSQSQSHSRSSSPTGPLHRKTNNNNNINNNNSSSSNSGLQQQPRTSCQVTQATSNTMTTSTSTSSSQTNITNSTALNSAMSLPPLSSMSANRSLLGQQQQLQSQTLPPLLPPRPLASMSNVGSYNRHNNIDSISTTTSSKQQQPPPPPRLKSLVPGDLLRDANNKEMPNFKGSFQNCSSNEIRRLSDEDISKIDMTSNVLNNMKTQQATNGLNQTPEKKLDGLNSMQSMNECMENELLPMENVTNDNSNSKSVTMPDQGMMNYHHQNHTAMANIRRYPPSLDPTHMQMFPAPPAIYPTQNTCYGCLTTVPIAGIQNRFSRCNGPQVYCITQLQALRLEPENSRHCSQSSSSDSTGSRSPPETPPAAPWLGNDNGPVPSANNDQQQHQSGGPPALHSIPSTHSVPLQQQQQPPSSNQERQRARKSQAHIIRHKNHSSGMLNGGGPPQAPPTSLQPCMTFPVPPGHTPMTAYLPHHAHFPALRPTTGIYSNFTHAYARPAPAGYPTLAYQPNGEMMYQYPGHPPPGSSNAVATATGTPPPPPAAVAAAAAAAAVQSTPNQVQQQQSQQQSYVPASSVVTYAPVNAVPQTLVPPKVSCYNCGSSSHMAPDCKEQTMEDITRGAHYRLDYATMKQSGSEQCQNSDK